MGTKEEIAAQTIATSYEPNSGNEPHKHDSETRSKLLSIDAQGDEKLNKVQLIQLGLRNPKALIREVLRLPLKRLFWKGIRYRGLNKAFFLLGILFALQMKYSNRARTYAKRVTNVLMFSVTFFGLLICLVVLFIKLKLHKNHSAIQRQASQQQL